MSREELVQRETKLQAEMRELTLRYNTLGKSPAECVELDKVMTAKAAELQNVKDDLSRLRLA